MGRSRRTLDRRALRADNEAAERVKGDDETEEGTEEEESEDEEEETDEAEAEAEAEAEDEGGDDEEVEVKPKKKKAPAKPKAKAPAKPRTRTPKVTRMKVVWVVYNNSHQPVEEFDYPKRKEAEEALTRLQAEKKTGSPFFLQSVKKPMDK